MANFNRRPQSLSDITDHVVAGAPLGYAVREFLDHWAALTHDTERAAAWAVSPPILAGRIPDGAVADAYLAAVAEKLAWDHRMEPPEWIFGPERFLRDPWFAASDIPGLRPLLLMESPVSFRRRNLFVTANALERARSAIR